MAEEDQEQEEQETEAEDSSDSSWGVIKGSLILLGVCATGAMLFFVMFNLSSTAKEKQVIPDANPQVKLFSEKLRLTRQTGPKPVDQKRWTLEPPIIELNMKLTKSQVKKVRKRIKKEEKIFRGRVDTYLRHRKVDFAQRPDAKKQISNFIKSMLEKGSGDEGILPPGWIKNITIPSFNSGI